MCEVTISLLELFRKFPDAESARVYFEERRWSKGVVCPHCEESERITKRKNGYYRCNSCKEDFTVRTGTIFERSHVPLSKWLYAMYMLMTARKGISSMQLSKEIGVTQKTAWFMLQRLREAVEMMIPCLPELLKLMKFMSVEKKRISIRIIVRLLEEEGQWARLLLLECVKRVEE